MHRLRRDVIADRVPDNYVIKQLTRSSVCQLGTDSSLPNTLLGR